MAETSLRKVGMDATNAWKISGTKKKQLQEHFASIRCCPIREEADCSVCFSLILASHWTNIMWCNACFIAADNYNKYPQIHERRPLKKRGLIPNISQRFIDRNLQVLQMLSEPQLNLCVQKRGRDECATSWQDWSYLQLLERLRTRGTFKQRHRNGLLFVSCLLLFTIP